MPFRTSSLFVLNFSKKKKIYFLFSFTSAQNIFILRLNYYFFQEKCHRCRHILGPSRRCHHRRVEFF